MRYVFLIIIVLFLAMIAAFAFQNLQSVTVAFIGLQLTAPLAVLVALVYLLGMATGGSLFTFLRYSLHKATTAPRPRAPAPAAPKIIDHQP
ncbi:MAG: hypothetical protein AB7P07_05090 [Hyphomonadaceae bacterium]